MKPRTFKMKIIVFILFISISLLFSVPLAKADPTLEEAQFYSRVASAFFEAYVMQSNDPDSLYAYCMEIMQEIRASIQSANYGEAIAFAQEMIDTILALHPGFTIFISDDGIHLFQTPPEQQLIQGERGYIPFAIFNEISEDLNVSISSTNSGSRFVTSQTISAHQGSSTPQPYIEFASAVIPTIDVVSTTPGVQTVPLEIEVTEAGTGTLIDSLDTSFDINVSVLGATQNLFSYLPSRQTPESDFTSSVAILDIDGNGMLDAYFGNYMYIGVDNYPEPAENTAWYNQGKGRFRKQSLDTTAAKGTRDAVAADVDGDGVFDHVIDANINVRIADGYNAIRSLPDLTPIEMNETAHDVVDVIADDINLNDTDPKPHLLINNIDDRVELYLNDPSSPTGFEANPHWTSNGSYAHIALGDVDGDGVKDLAVAQPGYAKIYRGYAYGSSNIWFDESPNGLLWIMSEKTYALMQLLFSDLDNDNDEDFIIVAQDVHVYLNNNGTLEEATGWPQEFKHHMPSCADIGDINNDGINDIVIGFYTSFDPPKRLLGGENRIYLGETDSWGNFTFNTTPAWVAYYSDKTTDIKLANLDQDNLLDLVIANDGQNYIYFNMDAQVFTPVLPKDPSSFYKGNVYSQVNAPPATPAPNYSQPTNVGDTIGVTADIGKVSEAAQMQANFEYTQAKVAGFWSGFKSEFEGMIYFNRIDAEIAAVINGGAERVMLFNPGTGEKWAQASNNGKTFDNIDTYAWTVEKFCQRYGPSGLLAQENGWNGIEVFIGNENEPEMRYEDTYETTVERQAKLFDVAKNIDPNIIVTTSNHGGMGGALLEFNNVAQAIGLGPYDKFDIFRYQFYLNGGSFRGAMDTEENWYSDEFYSPSFPLYEWGMPYITDLLTDPTLPWSGIDYGICMGEGGNKADTYEVYGNGPWPTISDLPFISQSQWANEVVGNQLRNAANSSQATCPNDIFSDTAVAAKLALRTLIETLNGYEALDSGWPEMLNNNNVLVYKFQNTANNSFTYWIRAFPGYGDQPFEPQTITLELSSPASIYTSKTLFDGEVFTGDDVVAVNENYMDPILYPNPEDRWVYRDDVTHGGQPLIISQNLEELTITIPDYIFYCVQEVPQGSNFAPNINPIASPQTVDEGDVLTIQLSATDPNPDDRLTFTYSPIIPNAEIHSTGLTTAEFIFEPDYTQSGVYQIVFTVTDEGGLPDNSPPIQIGVYNINQVPQFNPIAPKRVAEGGTLTFDVSAFDPDGDDLYFEVESAPSGFRMTSTNPTTTATFTWQPTYAQAGNYDVVISVTDRQITTPVTTTIPIEVINTNLAPELHPMGPFGAREGILLEFTAVAFEPDGDPIEFFSPNLPEGATLDPQTGEFAWTPDYNQGAILYEEYLVTIVARDNQGGQDSEAVIIQVEDINRAPVLDPLSSTYTVNENEILIIDLNASDPDEGDTLTFSYSPTTIPNAQLNQINNTTARFIFNPDYEQAGNYHIAFIVTDQGGLHDWQTVTIEVVNVNRPPEVEPIPPQTVAEGETLTFQVVATDPDNDPLFYDVIDPPENFRIDSQTGECLWEPNYNQAGSYIVEITVSDHEATVTAPVHIEVINTNRAPELHPMGPFDVREGVLLEFTAVAIDPDGDPLTFSSSNLPNGATLNSQTGIFSWTPNYSQAGFYIVTIIVRDNLGGQDQEDVEIEVENVNQAPILNPLPSSLTVNEGDLLTFTISGYDPDNDPITYGADHLPDGATLDENSGVFEWTPGAHQSGVYTINFYAQDIYQARSDPVPVEITVIDTQ